MADGFVLNVAGDDSEKYEFVAVDLSKVSSPVWSHYTVQNLKETGKPTGYVSIN